MTRKPALIVHDHQNDFSPTVVVVHAPTEPGDSSHVEENSQGTFPAATDIERLGRERPPIFGSAVAEDYFMSGFHTILPAVIDALQIPPTQRTWPSSALSLVAGSLLVPAGRLGDVYGGYVLYNIGFAWLAISALACGFARSSIALILLRALMGVGAVAVLPTGMMLIGRTYRPGPRKNLVFGIYGAVAVLGMYAGILGGGLAGQFATWRTYFYAGAVACAVTSAASLVSIPRDLTEARRRAVKMDWIGTATLVPGLFAVVFAITEARNTPHGFRSSLILVCLFTGLAFLVATVWIQGWVLKNPLLPAQVFKPKYMKRMIFSLFMNMGVFGIFIYYSNVYIETILHKSPLTTAIWFTPWGVAGTIFACTGGLMLHIIPGNVLLIICGACNVIAVLLFALIPHNPNYWAWIFPAMLAATAYADVVFTCSNVFLTTSLPRHLQGVAGAIMNCCLNFGVAFWLGVADIAVGATSKLGEEKSLRSAFWVAVGASTAALCVMLTMDIGNAKSDFTAEERDELGRSSNAR